jgi:hypothetical protein
MRPPIRSSIFIRCFIRIHSEGFKSLAMDADEATGAIFNPQKCLTP